MSSKQTRQRQLRVGLFGSNGHQIERQCQEHVRVKLAAVAEMDVRRLPQTDPPRQYDTLDQLLADPEVDLVSLCSPRRADQAAHAIACLEAGKHVYAEKPCALSESELDEILAVAHRTGRRFHEMAGTAFDRPYAEMRRIVAEGTLGMIVQVNVQKSYPYHPNRPQDEAVDGGLIMQVGVHALRMIEHVAGLRIRGVEAVETSRGNPASGDLRMAASLLCTLDGGAVASVICNYLNPAGCGVWGNEHLSIFGTGGLLESFAQGRRTRLVLGEDDHGPIHADAGACDYFDLLVEHLLDNRPMPLSLEQELSPTRWVIRAKQATEQADSALLPQG